MGTGRAEETYGVISMKTIVKVLLASVAWVGGSFASFVVLSKLAIPAPDAIPGTSPNAMVVAMIIASPLLAGGMAALACGLGGGSWRTRTVLFVFLYLALGVNTLIEASIFSIANVTLFLYLQYILPAAFLSFALARMFKPKPATPIEAAQFTPGGWVWRVVGAWLAFPAIYWIFGMCVAPFVIDYYNQGIAGLTIPPASVIFRTQLLRSAIFLTASLPIVLMWAKSRRSLIIALGLAHTVCVGVYSLAQAYWFPSVLRVAHSIEITADSFAYATVLAILFSSSAVHDKPPIAETVSVA